jgi:3alpha(or 20beta)-hydroxysteroid dehydrogenase
VGRVDGKVVLITGGARGQGASHGELLAREGAQVVLADILDDEGQALAEGLSGQGLAVRYTHLDVASQDDWAAAVAFAEAAFGHVTVLVNNAGISSPAGIADCTLENWHRVIAVDQTGVFLGMQSVIPGMRAAGAGSIINTASGWAHTGGAPNRSVAYVAAKAAVLALTRNAALSLAIEGIRVNSVSPEAVSTPMAGERFEDMDDVHKQLVLRTPMQRMAKPIEISYAVLYLASDESTFTTGVDFLIDGGLHTV